MEDRRSLVDEIEVRRIIRAAAAMMQKSRTTPEVRRQLLGFVQLIEAECQSVEDDGRTLNPGTLLSLVEAAFAVGAIAGTPAMVTALRAGQHAAGGVASGKSRGRSMAEWKAHATGLMRAIRTAHPEAPQETVATETRETWKLDNVKAPGFSALVKHLRNLERSGEVPRQRKD